jgi:sarcosine oxidase
MNTRNPKVAVIGLGSVGSMALWRLAKRGADVTGYEQYGVCHDRGAYGGESRVFRTAYFENSEYVPLIRRARQLWRELEAETGAELLTLSGSVTIGSASSMPMGNITASIEQFGVDAEPVVLDTARARWPQLPFEDSDFVVIDHEGGYLRPELSVLSATLRARALGATVHAYAPVTAIDVGPRGVQVNTQSGTERYDHVVVTTGPWATAVIPEAASCIEIRRPVSAWFLAKNRALFRPDRCPCFARTTPLEWYGLPALDGSGLKLGLSKDLNQLVDDPDQLDRSVPLHEVQTFRELAETYFPDLYPDPVRVSAYQEAYTPDGHGLVGSVPWADRATIAVGLSGHGFKLAPVLGEIAADLALTGTSTQNLPLLAPGRYLRDGASPRGDTLEAIPGKVTD